MQHVLTEYTSNQCAFGTRPKRYSRRKVTLVSKVYVALCTKGLTYFIICMSFKDINRIETLSKLYQTFITYYINELFYEVKIITYIYLLIDSRQR